MAAPSVVTLSTCVFVGFLVVCGFSVANGERMQGGGGMAQSVDFTGDMAGQGFAAPSRKMLAKPRQSRWLLSDVNARSGVPAYTGPCALCEPLSECVGVAWWC
ncbi:hypothetical protein BSKO_03842 [Bryopsis sp. KO-2023]|nr:hypothetical protein BSKO_03842 [Bryopsis sp. KO-2023]